MYSKNQALFILVLIVVLLNAIVLSASVVQLPGAPVFYRFPYAKVGLTEEQAAAHLVSRFTYGATPGMIDNVMATGLENWFEKQLAANTTDAPLDERLRDYDALTLSNAEVVNTYYKNAQILRMAVADGVIDRDSAKVNIAGYREQLQQYARDKNIRSERELTRQFINQKILRAVYSENQLQEVLTEFWFNHFNVSFTKRICSQFIPAYERDVIRPRALGKFQDLLIATAKSPAMLLYLDNFSSVGAMDSTNKKRVSSKKRMRGLNENYAREVMELHTLGVDGGYTQNDVTEAARILTGWTIYPMGKENFGNGYRKLLDNAGEEKLTARGYIHDGDFLFTPNRHDTGEKKVLGIAFKAGGGYDQGIQLLQMLAAHPSTAKFIAAKIATRFVSDNPPASLIDAMAKTFRDTDGDIKRVLITMTTSVEFWDVSAIRTKTKSPFELAISSIRALQADIRNPYPVYTWLTRMGQPVYFYQAPTGFPDKGQHWINTGSLLNRMNFGLALADKRIPGIKFNLLGLNNNHEPESAEDALATYSKLLMPGRNLDKTIQQLTPLLNAPDLQQKVDEAAGKAAQSTAATDSLHEEITSDQPLAKSDQTDVYRLSQIVGILLGSPEFQRR
jgi:uncharacterized protein (DUF1800 family)